MKMWIGCLSLYIFYGIDMASEPLIPTERSTRDEARVTKAKLGITWDEFVQRATEELDPDT